MDETRINNEEMEKDNVEKYAKGKLGHDEEKRVINVVGGEEDHTTNANANALQKGESSKIDSPKKTRKSIPKTNVTLPRPFNLATEKRMTRERKGSMDFKDQQPKPLLFKSSSFNPKTSNPKGTGTSLSKTSSKPIRANIKDDKNRGNNLTKQEGDKTKNVPKENPTFKALPLPNFYRKKNSPHPKLPETKKMAVGRSRPPAIGDQVKTLPKIDNNKTEGNAKRVSKGMGGGAKEIISKVIRNTKNSLRTNPKETAKDSV